LPLLYTHSEQVENVSQSTRISPYLDGWVNPVLYADRKFDKSAPVGASMRPRGGSARAAAGRVGHRSKIASSRRSSGHRADPASWRNVGRRQRVCKPPPRSTETGPALLELDISTEHEYRFHSTIDKGVRSGNVKTDMMDC